jgi:hypothetical protein
MDNTQILQFPIKGVNRTFSRSTQPENTAYDMLNVLPFDRTGRLRGGKRCGTTKVWTAALGGDTDAVVLVDQVTYAVNPATDPSETLVTDTFSYADGALSTVSSDAWAVYDDTTALASTKMTVVSNACVTPHQSSNNNVAVIAYPNPAPDYDQTAGYTVSVDVTLPDKGVTFLSQSTFALYLEEDITTRYAEFPAVASIAIGHDGSNFVVEGTNRGVSDIQAVDADSFSTTASITAGTPFTLLASVSADRVVTFSIDGVTVGHPLQLVPAEGVRPFGLYNAVGDDTGDGITMDNVSMVGVSATAPGTGERTRSTKIIAIANRDVFLGTRSVQGAMATNGSNVIKKGSQPQGCYSAGKYYIVDGLSIIQVDMATSAVETYAATEGTAPSNTVACAMWRDRLVLAGPDQNVYFSRVGVHTDWDYASTEPDAAFTANASTAGHIGDPVVALMPLSDDVLAIAGDHTLHVVRGDPPDGGSIDLVSDAIGILGPRAWCKAPEGTVYFLGTGGLFKWDAGSQPVNISDDKWAKVFTDIDRSVTRVSMAWDRDRVGMYIFLYRHTASVPPRHLWYDRRTDGFFPIEFPLGHGPTAAVVYDGDGSIDRTLILGCRDGYLRQFSQSAMSDDGDSIESYVLFPPILLGDVNNDGVMGNATFTFGEASTGFTVDDLSVQAVLRGGLTSYDVTEGRDSGVKLTVLSRTYAGQSGRVTRLVGKIRGAWGSIELKDDSSDKTWSFESVAFTVAAAGLSRR